MRLSEFMLTHREQILAEWVAFARSCLTSDTMDLAELRDHASEMLDTIAADLNRPQTRLEQADKSAGKSDAEPDSGDPDTAAQSHGAARAESGFTVEQMVSEYRALRASVTRLWIEKAGELTRTNLDDLSGSMRPSIRRWLNRRHASRRTSIIPRRCFSPCSATISARRSAPSSGGHT